MLVYTSSEGVLRAERRDDVVRLHWMADIEGDSRSAMRKGGHEAGQLRGAEWRARARGLCASFRLRSHQPASICLKRPGAQSSAKPVPQQILRETYFDLYCLHLSTRTLRAQKFHYRMAWESDKTLGAAGPINSTAHPSLFLLLSVQGVVVRS
ncbi:hypothetical protein CALVIDRAFT_397744 [Calocera viscosa TUFC12733]|uniref:Uncharacterized protein n=1 Tax=Calocera viscosa (strain TUFC12733) TaxID=1330018 RepID=A0A167PRL5_CALVF|nr:hypothetical protein CALVIDRAFT_397744 [Calocera viscosa TUFC12733]